MSKQLKRLLAASLEDAMVEPIIEEAPNELVLEEEPEFEVPELEMVKRLESTSDALDNFVENAPITDDMPAATLETCALALESILIAGGLSEFLGGKITEASMESIGNFRISIEETQARVHGAIRSFFAKIANRFKEMFGRYNMTFTKASKLIASIEEQLKSTGGREAPSHAEIKVTDGHRLFIDDKHSVADLKKGFENVANVNSAIDQSYINGLVAFTKQATDSIMNAYSGTDSAISIVSALAKFLMMFSKNPHVQNGGRSLPSETDSRRNNRIVAAEAKEFFEKLNDAMGRISKYKGMNIPMPGGRVVEMEERDGGMEGVPYLRKDDDLKNRAVVTIATPSVTDIKALLEIAKQVTAKIHAAGKVLENGWYRITKEMEATIHQNKSSSDKSAITKYMAANSARAHLTSFVASLFSTYSEIIEYSGTATMHLLAFCEKAAKLYH